MCVYISFIFSHRFIYSPSRTEKDAILPLSVPVKGIDGSLIEKLAIPAGTSIILPLVNANSDPALWGPDSREWKPDRWLSPLPQALQDARVPGVYSHMYGDTRDCLLRHYLITQHRMSFLGGARACMSVLCFESSRKYRLTFFSYEITAVSNLPNLK